MSAEQMSFKAMIKRIANEEQIPAQVVLQNFAFLRKTIQDNNSRESDS